MRRATLIALSVLVLALVALAVNPGSARAQVVRGTVTAGRQPAVGALVTLLRFPGADTLTTTDVRSVLADANGRYLMPVSSPGRYRVLVRRIGWRGFRSAVLDLAPGDTARLDMELEAAVFAGWSVDLPEVRVRRVTPCRTDAGDATRIATLWDNARTALLSTELSLRDGLSPLTFARYTRNLDPGSLAVLEESLHFFDERDAPGEPTFRSLSGDSLSVIGYWRRVSGESTTFHGPDASALLSEAFVRDHCFTLAEGTGAGPGVVALLFEPVPQRTRPGAPAEIRGAIWLDSSTAALRHVEFSWIALPGRAPTRGLGGEVHFTRSQAGQWYVSRWWLRMPQDLLEVQGSGGTVTRFTRVGVVEEGGYVWTDSVGTAGEPAVIRGVLRDEDRRPLGGAIVRILGTALVTATDAGGRFRFAAVPPGLRVLVADHESTRRFGVRAGEVTLLLDPGSERSLSVRAPGRAEVIRQLCGASTASDAAVLRLTLVDSLTSRPLADQRVSLAPEGGSAVMTSTTDADGGVVFCGVPPRTRLEARAVGTGRSLLSVTLARGEIVVRQVVQGRP